jgi:hypothetical protein
MSGITNHFDSHLLAANRSQEEGDEQAPHGAYQNRDVRVTDEPDHNA